ncbi:MAG: GTP-binding protein [Candidatus Lokiarchaeota archaeon]|nr:GTP-binding protein [Candidatus Lokiarchaeota archaeon]
MEVINAIIYLDLDENKPSVNFWYPFSLSEDISRFIAKKCYSIISEDEDFIPEILLIFPVQSLKLKALIKYFKRQKFDSGTNFIRSAIIFLFDEKDDNIFYRYMSYLDPYFNETIGNIAKLEAKKVEKEVIYEEIVKLQQNLHDITNYLKTKSEYVSEEEDVKGIMLDFDPIVKRKYKVVILGDPSVGKTSTILRFTDNVFLRAYIPTMGLNITQKIFKVNNSAIELVMWDIGGQQKFELIRRQFYDASSAFILLFDLTNPRSFANIPNWYYDLRNYNEKYHSLPGFLIGNKLDLINQRIVTRLDAVKIANSLNLDYFETSALTGYNIELIFHELASILLNYEK